MRLGDYDLVETSDISSPENYRVSRVLAHPEFNGVGFYNDLALLELDRDVEFNRFILPVCLPTGRSRHSTFQGTYPTGWQTYSYHQL